MPDRIETADSGNNSPAINTNDIEDELSDYMHDADIFRQSLSIPVSRYCCSMSMAPSSRDVALASRYGLHIVDLTTPLEPACYLRYDTCWDPVEVRWSPHRARENWVATTSNQRVLIWNVQASPNNPVELILPGHKRAISDLHWSPYQSNMIATGALDTYIHLWDLRTPNRPVISLCAWTAGAARVQYNRKNEFVIASAHAHTVKIWDTRKGTAPIIEIHAHDGKVNYVDWSIEEENELLTCGQDRKLKFWNIQQDSKECIGTIMTNAPVRLARYAPFGPAVVSAAQRLDPTLRLWAQDADDQQQQQQQQQPIHTFAGSSEPFRKFGWRIRNDLDDEFQLVALSLDGYLRLYPVDKKTTAMCGKQGKSAMAKQRPTHSLKQLTSAVLSCRRTMQIPHIPLDDGTTPPCYTASSIHPMSTGTSTPGSSTPTTGLFPSQALLGTPYTRSGHMGPDMSPSNRNSSYNMNFSYATPPDYKIQNDSAAVFRSSPQHPTLIPSPDPLINNPLLPRPCMPTPTTSSSLGNDASEWSLPEEFALTKRKYPQVQFEKFDPLTRSCSLSLDGPWSNTDLAFVHVSIVFPHEYPSAPPEISVHRSAAIPMAYRSHMIKGLTQIVSLHAEQRQPCLDSIISFLLGGHVRMKKGQDDGSGKETAVDGSLLLLETHGPRSRLLSGQDRSRVPYPRLCGAVFGIDGRLIVFFSKKTPLTTANSMRRPSKMDAFLAFPRRVNRSETSLQDMLNAIGLPPGWPRSYDRYEHGLKSARRDSSRLRGMASYDEDTDDVMSGGASRSDKMSHVNDHDLMSPSRKDTHYSVGLFNFSNLLPVSRLLASKYKLSGDHPAEVALENAEMARSLGRHDLSHMWTLASLILEDALKTNQSRSPRRLRWGLHPFGRRLVQNLLDYLARLGDVQTLAMFCCVFAEPYPPIPAINLLNERQAPMLPLGSSAGIGGHGGVSSTGGVHGSGSGNRDYFTMPTTKSRSFHSFMLPPAPSLPAEPLKTSALSYLPGFGLRLSQVSTRDTDTLHGSDVSQSDAATTIAATTTTITTTRSPHSNSHTASSISGFAPSNLHGPLAIPTTITTTGMARSYASEHTAIISPSLVAAVTSAVPIHPNESWLNMPHALNSVKSDSGFKVMMLHNERDFDSETRPRHVSLLDPLHWGQYDCYRLYYAELLFRWGLLKQRSEILKFASSNAIKRVHATDFDERRQLNFGGYCPECRTPLLSQSFCEQCKRYRKGIECALCHITVRGLVNVCLVCQHGGHQHHIREWFKQGNADCPTGCGCICVLACGEFK
ncbi:hypothetical protein BDF19DRAFT_456772 [Syncephalis fuscata]|nr:hypothetical protein BDF19DRAFT_456772 [Syncephalis fuscata]